MNNNRSSESTVRVLLGSFALFLILLPEPATTFIGLGFLSLVRKSSMDEVQKEQPICYRRDLLYGGILNRRVALGLQPAPISKQGLLSSAHIESTSVYAHPSDWIHLRKTVNVISTPHKDIPAARGELPVVKANIPSMYYSQQDWKSYRNNSKKPVSAQPGGSTSINGELPIIWPNLPNNYSNPRQGNKIIQSANTAVQESGASSLQGQLPLPWPNMPETRFTNKLHRATR